jgi:hypothetical protein
MKTLQILSITFYLATGSLFMSCASSYEAIGKVSMLSNRSIDTTLHYKLLAANPIKTAKQLKGYGEENINQAVNETLTSVYGGLYLTNVTIYVVNGNYYKVTGDVWGYDSAQNRNTHIAYKKSIQSTQTSQTVTPTTIASK